MSHNDGTTSNPRPLSKYAKKKLDRARGARKAFEFQTRVPKIREVPVTVPSSNKGIVREEKSGKVVQIATFYILLETEDRETIYLPMSVLRHDYSPGKVNNGDNLVCMTVTDPIRQNLRATNVISLIPCS